MKIPLDLVTKLKATQCAELQYYGNTVSSILYVKFCHNSPVGGYQAAPMYTAQAD